MSLNVLTHEVQTTLYTPKTYIAKIGPQVDGKYPLEYAGFYSTFKRDVFGYDWIKPNTYINATQLNPSQYGTPTYTIFTGYALSDDDGNDAWGWLVGDEDAGIMWVATRFKQGSNPAAMGIYLYKVEEELATGYVSITSLSTHPPGQLWDNWTSFMSNMPKVLRIVDSLQSNTDQVQFMLTDASITSWTVSPSTGFQITEAGDPELYPLFREVGEVPDPLDPTQYDDPYQDGGYSRTGGGGGTFTFAGDDIDFPTAPSINASSTGFVTIFTPTLAQIQSLADYMWNGVFDINNLRKLFADPMDCILGLSIVPVAVTSTSAEDVCIGNIISSVQCNVADSQYVWVDCGTIHLDNFSASYLDYEPYTRVDLYLPFVGSIKINTDDVMGKDIHVKYLVDILTGGFTVFVKCGCSVLYSYSGTCAAMVPITGNNWSDLYRTIAGLVSGIGTGSAAGAIAGAVGSSTAEAASQSVAQDAFSIGKDVAVGSASAVMAAKPSVQHSGSMSGSSGQLGIRTPYITVTIPRQCLPLNQNRINGYPSWVYKKLGDLEGFTVVQNMNLEGITATAEERLEISELLAKGVIL